MSTASKSTDVILAERRDRVVQLAKKYRHSLPRTQRLYLEEPSHCTAHERSLEFDIKRSIADFFGVPYRSVVFTGSGHLGFSPSKGTLFSPGNSDLDVAILDIVAYQEFFEVAIEHSRAFTDFRGYTYRGGSQAAAELKDYIARRGMIPLWRLPACSEVTEAESFLAQLSQRFRQVFGGISVVFYISEYAFCWKQDSAIRQMMADSNAK